MRFSLVVNSIHEISITNQVFLIVPNQNSIFAFRESTTSILACTCIPRTFIFHGIHTRIHAFQHKYSRISRRTLANVWRIPSFARPMIDTTPCLMFGLTRGLIGCSRFVMVLWAEFGVDDIRDVAERLRGRRVGSVAEGGGGCLGVAWELDGEIVRRRDVFNSGGFRFRFNSTGDE